MTGVAGVGRGNDLDSDEAEMLRSKRTEEPVQAKNKRGTTPSNQTRWQAGGLTMRLQVGSILNHFFHKFHLPILISSWGDFVH